MLYIAAFFLAVLICSLLALKFDKLSIRSNSKYQIPKGPTALPIVGNLLQIVKNPHLKFSKWVEKYGTLYTVYFGNKQALVISDSKLIKELFRHPAASGRHTVETWLELSQGHYGMLNNEGPAWVEQRQFFKTSLMEFGGSAMEHLILAEADEVCEWIENEAKKNTGCVIFNDILKCATINSLWTIVSGERLKIDDMKVAKLLETYFDRLQYTMKTGLGFFTWMRHVAPNLSGHVAFGEACKGVREFVNGHFEEHKRSFVEGSLRDVIDAYIDHVDKTTKNGNESSSFYGKDGHINTISVIFEIFIAGGETTASTINFALFYLGQHPEIQEKVFEEIDEVIGNGRDPCLLDRPKMPLVDAVILETLRYSTFAPMGIIQRLTEDINFRQYRLPKGLLLIPNIYHCHHSSEIWGDPEIFRPNRFLENPTLKDCLAPFQPGRRSCPGEYIARDMLFLFVTKMFQKWKVSPHPNISKAEYFSPDVGLALMPKRLEVVMTKRELD